MFVERTVKVVVMLVRNVKVVAIFVERTVKVVVMLVRTVKVVVKSWPC